MALFISGIFIGALVSMVIASLLATARRGDQLRDMFLDCDRNLDYECK